ncbi:MAG: phospholipase [Paludibacteraceae bacterium]|nr:phospholipase [Paludibacteraceae bacterium]
MILFVCLGIVVLVVFEVRARKQQQSNREQSDRPTLDSEASNSRETASDSDDGCCGEHLVCERETLLQTNAVIIYYDDEELDSLAGIPAEEYTQEQYQMIREVFDTLKAKDVPGWVRSIQLRNIQLPLDIREEALLIVVERRKA